MVFNWLRTLTNVPTLDEKSIVYLMNDPGTPTLRKLIPVPIMASPSYKVRNYSGGGHILNTTGGRAAQTFVVITETLKWVQRHAPEQLSNWATGLPLVVDPEAGEDLNAYYYRKGMKFFYSGNVYTALSADVVAHELGHAIFDSFRPDTWSVASLELWSFHEAFADMTAILTALQNEEIINLLLKDRYLEKDNLVSRVGEQIGKAIYDIKKGEDGRSPLYLRNAATKFKYADPSTLGTRGRHDVIVAESHSFGRIMLGALYAIWHKMYEYNVLRGLNQKHALVVSRNLFSKYLLTAITIVPKTPRFFQSFARSLMWVAQQDNPIYHKLIREILIDWKIVGEIDAQSDINDGVEVIKLSEEMEIGILAHNPLYEVEVEIPTDNRQEGIEDAKRCLDLLNQTNSVSDMEATPFEIQDNKLIRTHI
jgi:hypothetical protein